LRPIRQTESGKWVQQASRAERAQAYIFARVGKDNGARISIYVDGITRDVVAVEPQQLWSNDQLERLGISVVPPTPRRPPKPTEIDLPGVNRMFSLLAGVGRPTKRALRLDAIVGRVTVR